MSLFVDVLLPIPLQNAFTYKLSPLLEEEAKVGCRVIVQFGAKKFYTGIIYRFTDPQKVPNVEIKEVLSILDSQPIVNPSQLKLWEWIADYYMCALGDIYKAALPSALKIESETYVEVNSDFKDVHALTHTERQIYSILLNDNKAQKLSDIEKKSPVKVVYPHIKALVDKDAIFLRENLQRDYRAKKETYIKLVKDFTEPELHSILDTLRRSPKQQECLIKFLDLGKDFISKKEFIALSEVSDNSIKELVNKSVFEFFEEDIDRIDYGEAHLDEAKALNEYQLKALREIDGSFLDYAVTLLKGVTGSGKTEIYIELIKEVIAQKKQVLFLVPEIALTTQLTSRLKKVFGNILAVYHSKFNDKERAEVWNKLLKNECQIILGARSSVFLPFNALGLIIIDEEHEASYKQQDPTPRYNAKNTALILAHMHKAKTLLGTATPSIETYYNAKQGKYGLVELNQRYKDMALPTIHILDTKEMKRKKQMKSILAPQLIHDVAQSLEDNKQAILFQNRRGYSPLLECKVCAWTPKCKHCDISLTYHKGARILVCHYCDATYPIPQECPNCETATLECQGYGTERIEQEVEMVLPEAKVARMDLDTTRSKTAFDKLISSFESHKTNVLVGTQMVSKGLDFDDVSVVGILNADSLLNMPNFRSHERAFQMLTQVSGRAGRKGESGRVYIQTAQAMHPIIRFVKEANYEAMYAMQIAERELFNYPPYCRLLEITLKGRNEDDLHKASLVFTDLLRKSFDNRVLGPASPPISRIQNLYIRKIILKLEPKTSNKIVYKHIQYAEAILKQVQNYKSLLIYVDVDPL